MIKHLMGKNYKFRWRHRIHLYSW